MDVSPPLAEEVVMVGDKQIRLVAKRTKSACVNCKAAKVGCGSTRPCMWCIRHGIEATCMEAPKKARKPRTLKRKSPDTDEIVHIKPDTKDLTFPNAVQTLVPYPHTLTHPSYPATLPTAFNIPQTLSSSSLTSSLSSLEIDPSLLELMYSNHSSSSSTSSIFNPHLTLDQLMEMAGADDDDNTYNNDINANNYATNNDSNINNNSNISNYVTNNNNNSNINNIEANRREGDDDFPIPKDSPSSSYTASSSPSSSSSSPSTDTFPPETNTNNINNNTNANNNNTNNNTNNTNNNNNFNMPQTGSTFINNMLNNSIMGSLFSINSNGESTPFNFGGVIFNELSKIQKAVETITILTQIQQQPLNGSNLAANTSPYPIALFSSVDPVVVLQCNAAFAQLLGYHDINDAIMTRLDRILPGPFCGFALRRIKKTGGSDVPKKLSNVVFQSQTNGDMIICVAVIKRIQNAGCLMAIVKHTRASPELRAEMSRFVSRVSVLSNAVQDVFHLKKSLKTGEVRKPPHEKDCK